jgi:hypothetical protein
MRSARSGARDAGREVRNPPAIGPFGHRLGPPDPTSLAVGTHAPV